MGFEIETSSQGLRQGQWQQSADPASPGAFSPRSRRRIEGRIEGVFQCPGRGFSSRRDSRPLDRSIKRVCLLLGLSLAVSASGCGGISNADIATVVQPDGHKLYTCCNIHYEREKVSDANYYVGETLPLGTLVEVRLNERRKRPKVGVLRKDSMQVIPRSVIVDAGDITLKLWQEYGSGEESFPDYLGKIFVSDDPNDRLQTFSQEIQSAIRASRVLRGMTRDQVIMAIGYPPSHQTPSIEQSRWTYWNTRLKTYRVTFDDAGRVSELIGHVPKSFQ